MKRVRIIIYTSLLVLALSVVYVRINALIDLKYAEDASTQTNSENSDWVQQLIEQPADTTKRLFWTPEQSSDSEAIIIQKPSRPFDFYTLEKEWNASKQAYEFFRHGTYGTEQTSNRDQRRYFLSEDQANYPEPESGCGPTALLNLYIWYTKFGLIQESVRHSDLDTYKRLKFAEIDQRIGVLQGRAQRRETGTNTLEQVVVIDELLKTHSPTPLRMHYATKKPPLDLSDFLNISKHFRAGILSVRPLDPKTGRLRPYHAVLVIRADTSGTITIANWGTFSHGRLTQKSDGQWFIPSNPKDHSLKIVNFTTLIPFSPKS